MEILTISTANSRKSTNWEQKRVTWDKLRERLSKTKYTSETEAEYTGLEKEAKVNVKDIGGFVGGRLEGTSRKASQLIDRCILALDIDYGTQDVWDDYEMLCDWECLMHTTHSHTKENPRYRMFFPLKRPVTKDEYEPLGRKIAAEIGIELFDDTTFQASRMMFWPSTCSDGEFHIWHHEGDWVDPDEILALYDDWKNVSEWPVSVRRTETIHKSTAEKQADPRQKMGIVGAFCNVYDVPAAINAYLGDVYIPTEDPNRYTYTGGSTVGGLVIYDDGLFAYSHHDTDPAHGQLCNAFDLVRLHKCPDADGRKSYEAMKDFLRKDTAVNEALDALIHSENLFDDDADDEEPLKRGEYDFTETGNAIRLKDRYGPYMRYNPSLGWCTWNGELWETDSEASAILNIMRQNDLMLESATNLLEKMKPEGVETMKKADYPEDYQLALNYYAWAKQSRGYTNILHTLKAARSVIGETETEKFDPDPWELNTPQGIVDLRSGEIQPHKTWHMCTMITKVSPNWEIPHPRWSEFLTRVTGGDREFQAYLQQIAGMALVGAVYEENLVMVYGSGSNGKSTLFQIWTTVAGSYADTIRNEILLGNKLGTDVAGLNLLRGKRLVITSELEESQVMSGALLKKLTSRDQLSATVKYHEPITFKPSHTLILHTNHLPRLRSVDHGTQRRIAVAPFNAVIADSEKRTNFAEEMVNAEGPAILAWMIDGAIEFYNNHMTIKKPEIVEKATREYIEGEDKVTRFIAECCIRDPKGHAYSGNLFRRFKDWLMDNDLRWAGGSPAFRREIEGKGFYCVKDMKGLRVEGLVLDDDDMEEL